ncbi:MAG: hypothetical protein QF898_11985 [SAR202 cluster bacterium]|nr:hypothetical protein [SAR202 cluster bacterium]MDP6714754.1 hypothetical protein [SAR202 cluster bacterium]
MRNSIWLILAAVMVLAACGSQESEDESTPTASAFETPPTVEVFPTPLPALAPIAKSSVQPPIAVNSPEPPIALPPTAVPEPTIAADPRGPSLEDERTIYAPDSSTFIQKSPTSVTNDTTLTPPPPVPTPETIEPLESRRILLSTLGHTWESAGPDITLDDIIDAFETGYILVTGQTPEQAGWTPLVLSAGEYIEFVTIRHPGEEGFLQATSYCCEMTTDGLQTVVNGGVSPGTVLTSLAHEAGHALQRINNPSQNRHSRDSNVGAIREAQAYAFEAALIRALGAHGNVNVSHLLIEPQTDEYVDRWRARWTDKKDDLRFEHERGFLILWLAALADGTPGGAADQIASPLRVVDPKTLFDLHQKLVALEPGEADSYIDTLMEDLSDSLNVIAGTISIRATQFPSPGSVEDSHAPYVVP